MHLPTREKSVVYFTARWCPPCRRIAPFLAELSEETEGVAFGKVDIDDNAEAAEMAGVRSIPTFKFFQVRQRGDRSIAVPCFVVGFLEYKMPPTGDKSSSCTS